ncbi:hypothetical protein SCHPADRAFT_317783 [Schizopora paradoxa]|uniref:Uncharacterized protein n=1 Tax=Schizopora paradoxa TaxID=27342 RepID=A0A0H2RRG6_9AGAM|nr:hypothetical protein SCHPADRAFT_317783 [Schizopora paradoxa]
MDIRAGGRVGHQIVSRCETRDPSMFLPRPALYIMQEDGRHAACSQLPCPLSKLITDSND